MTSAGRYVPGFHRMVVMMAVLAVVVGMHVFLAPRTSAQAFVPIAGSGSSLAANALDQWRRDLNRRLGITVNYAANGSTAGRNDFRFGQVDFAVSEIPYGLTDGGVLDPIPQRAFGYMPIVASGLTFTYNLKIGGQRVTNLRLSGETIAKIFTQQITNWSDSAVKADNPRLALPDRTIVPVVRSDGAGTSAQFTAFLASQYPAIWDDYCRRAGRQANPCGSTSFFPSIGRAQGKAGAQGTAGFVAQDSSEGAITYVEYSYAHNAGFPVAKMLNAANYYVSPTAANVGVALLQAKINPDLTLDPSGIYTNPDPRAYPLSSYSHMIIPKDTRDGFTTEKGRTLSEFAYYSLCEGQQQADALGYSPLPINLVQAGLDQVDQIPGSTRKLNRNDLRGCNNPTFSPDGTNLLARDAPQPAPCDFKGASALCTPGTPPPGPQPLPRPVPPPAPAPSGAKATTTTLAVAGSPIPGIPVFLNVTVLPRSATGTVQFREGSSALGTPVPVIAGAAFLATSTLAPGTHSLTAAFVPANPAAFAPSSSPPVSLTVPARSEQTIFADLLRFLQALVGGAPR